MSTIAQNISEIRQQIAAAAARVGRTDKDIRLIAVSKTVPEDRIRAAIDAGQLCFGENYVQAAREKFSPLRDESDIELHLIGALQRNKAKSAVELFDVIQTVDREALAIEIDKAATRIGKVQRVLVQVNISGESSKSGCAPESTADLCRRIHSLDSLRLDGLMCIGTWYAPDTENDIRRNEFVRMRTLRDTVAAELGIALPELSMGMSQDFTLAIEEGATSVRVGTALFGARE